MVIWNGISTTEKAVILMVKFPLTSRARDYFLGLNFLMMTTRVQSCQALMYTSSLWINKTHPLCWIKCFEQIVQMLDVLENKIEGKVRENDPVVAKAQ